MAKINVPPFKDPQLLNFAKQIQDVIASENTGTQTGNGKPKIKRGDTTGDTYWNATDNNYWIFKDGDWQQLDGGLNANLKTGQVTKSVTGEFYGWYYRYLSIRYADSEDGTMGFSKYPTNKHYYGTYNYDDPGVVNAENPANYLWSNTDIPNNSFGTNQYYFYSTQGGRRFQYAIAKVNGQPDGNYTVAPTLAIDLDIITQALGPVAVTGEQTIRYSNSISGVTDFGPLSANKSFIGYWSKMEWDAASPTEQENPNNYTWKPLGTTVGPMDKVFVAAGQNGSLTFEVGQTASDASKFTDLSYQSNVNSPTLNPSARSGYVVTKLITQSGGGGIGYQQTNSPIAGSGDVTVSLPFVGQQGTFDARVYPFITVDQYGRVATLSQSNSSVEYFLASRNVYEYSGSTTVTLDHLPGQIMVFWNGVLLTPTADYTEGTPVVATGLSPTITIPRWSVGRVTVMRFRKVIGFVEQVDSAPFVRTDTTITMDMLQLPLPANVASQSEIVYINGVQLPDTEYTYVNTGGVTYIDLSDTEVFKAGSTITLLAFALVNTVPKFNQGNSETISGQSQYTFLYSPRPNNIIPTPLTYQLILTLSGIVIDETTTSPVLAGDYRWPIGSKTALLAQPRPASQEPLQYTVWVSDLAY